MRRLRALFGRESGEAGVAPFETKPARLVRERPMALPGILIGTPAEVRKAELETQQVEPASEQLYVVCSCQGPVPGEVTEGDIRLLRERLALLRAGYVNLARRLAEYLVEDRGLEVVDVLAAEQSADYLASHGVEPGVERFSVIRLGFGPVVVLPAEASDPVPPGTPGYCPMCRGRLWLGPVAA